MSNCTSYIDAFNQFDSVFETQPPRRAGTDRRLQPQYFRPEWDDITSYYFFMLVLWSKDVDDVNMCRVLFELMKEDAIVLAEFDD